MVSDFQELTPRDRARFYRELLAFVVPKPTDPNDMDEFIDLPPTHIILTDEREYDRKVIDRA